MTALKIRFNRTIVTFAVMFMTFGVTGMQTAFSAPRILSPSINWADFPVLRKINITASTINNGCIFYEVQEQIAAATSQLAAMPGVEEVYSISAGAKYVNASTYEGNMKWYALPRTREALVGSVQVFDSGMGLINPDCSEMSIWLVLRGNVFEESWQVSDHAVHLRLSNHFKRHLQQKLLEINKRSSSVKFSYKKPAIPQVAIAFSANTANELFQRPALELVLTATNELVLVEDIDKMQVRGLFTPDRRYIQAVEGGFEGGAVVPIDYYAKRAGGVEAIRDNVAHSFDAMWYFSKNMNQQIITGQFLPTSSAGNDYKTRIENHFNNKQILLELQQNAQKQNLVLDWVIVH